MKELERNISEINDKINDEFTCGEKLKLIKSSPNLTFKFVCKN